MRVRVGTSGYQYEQWRGGPYAPGCRPADMLAQFGVAARLAQLTAEFAHFEHEDRGADLALALQAGCDTAGWGRA